MTTVQQREHPMPDYRESHGRHRGGYPDLWDQERQRENDDRGQGGRHRMDDSALVQPGDWHRNCATDDERRRFEVAYRRRHGDL